MKIPKNEDQYDKLYDPRKVKYSISCSGHWLVKDHKSVVKKLMKYLLNNALKIEGFELGEFKNIKKFDFEKMYEKLIAKSQRTFFGVDFRYSLSLNDRYIGGELYRTNKQISLKFYNDRVIKKIEVLERLRETYKTFPTDYGCFCIKTKSLYKDYRPIEIFGKWQVENILISKEELLKVPAYKIEELPDGGVLIQHHKDIYNYKSLWKRLSYWWYQRVLQKCFIPWEEQVKKQKQRDKELGVTVRMVAENEVDS